MTTSVSEIRIAALKEIRGLEEKLISTIGKEQFERLSKTRLLSNALLVACPLSMAVEVEDGMRFTALMDEIPNLKSPSEISELFYKVFSLKYKTLDQPKFDASVERFFVELHKKFLKDLSEQYTIACTSKELEDIAQAEKELSEETAEDLTESLKMMNYGLAGGMQAFVDADKSIVFNPYIEAVEKDWRLSVNYSILEQCFDKALQEYGKEKAESSADLKNKRLKKMREDYLISLQTAKAQLAASNKDSKNV